MSDIAQTKIPACPDGDHKFENSQTDVVDSMSPPYLAEYVSAQHAFAQDDAVLQRIEDDLEDCRIRIARAHAQMRLLEHQRRLVQQRLFIHRARLSPVRTIPDEVLQEIFHHCLPDVPHVVPNVRSAPLVLTHVCRRWRIVAHGTSELWSSIALRDRGIWNFELELEMVRRWLDRSRLRPIQISIACTPCTDFGLGGNPSGSDIFQLAIAHSSHLEELCLSVNRTYLDHFISHADLPVLRSIVVSLHTDQRVDELVEPATSVSVSAPRLRHVAFEGNDAFVNLVPHPLRSQITHLSFSFDRSRTPDLALLFQHFDHLEHLALTLTMSLDAFRSRLPTPSDRRIFGPMLSVFEVRLDKDMLDFGDPTMLDWLLDLFELPALQSFVLATPPQSPTAWTWPQRALKEVENHMAWLRSPGVHALLSRSRYPDPRLEQRDIGF